MYIYACYIGGLVAQGVMTEICFSRGLKRALGPLVYFGIVYQIFCYVSLCLVV